MIILDCRQVGLLQPGNEEQIPLYAYLADFPRHVLTRNLRSSAYELYARNSVSRKLSVLYISIAFMSPPSIRAIRRLLQRDKYALCQFVSPQEAHKGKSCDCLAR